MGRTAFYKGDNYPPADFDGVEVVFRRTDAREDNQLATTYGAILEHMSTDDLAGSGTPYPDELLDDVFGTLAAFIVKTNDETANHTADELIADVPSQLAVTMFLDLYSATKLTEEERKKSRAQSLSASTPTESTTALDVEMTIDSPRDVAAP